MIPAPIPHAGILDGLRFDVRLAFRSLRRQPALVAAIVFTVGLAVAANTALFSIFDGRLFRPLPYSDAERIVHVDVLAELRLSLGRGGFQALSQGLENLPLLTDRAVAWPAILLEDGAAGVAEWDVRPARVSPSTLDLLDAAPLMGRLLGVQDLDATRDPRPAMISAELSRSRHAAEDKNYWTKPLRGRWSAGQRLSSRPLSSSGRMPGVVP